jgi:tetratricopeptide (TPR) repeat protein
MQAHVLSDPRLVKQAGRFAWLSVDSEKAENEPFLEKFPIQGYPTFLVIDPDAEKAALKWPGAASLKQFERLLDDGLLAMRAADGGGPEAALARADRANAEGDAPRALGAYREALAQGGPAWDRRGRALESLVLALQGADRADECAATALSEGPKLPRGTSFAAVTSNGLACALSAEGDPPPPWRKAAIAGLEPLVRQASTFPDLLADDRAWILQTLGEAREDAGDAAGARALARKLWSFLAAEARRTPNAELRASLDSFRTSAAISLGKPALAVPALQASEKALPEDYNPPYRLALLYRELGRHQEAAAAADRALAKAYGPRKLKVFELKAQALSRQGDAAAWKETLRAAVAFADGLPAGQRQGSVARLAERMRAQLADEQ